MSGRYGMVDLTHKYAKVQFSVYCISFRQAFLRGLRKEDCCMEHSAWSE